MGTWLPPEILLRIVSYVSDIGDLLSLRFVNHAWSEATDAELKRWCAISLDPDSMDKFDALYKKMCTRKRITDATIIVPHQDYGHVSAPK